MKRLLRISLFLSLLFLLVSCTQNTKKIELSAGNVSIDTVLPTEKKYDGSTAEYVKAKYGDLDYGGYSFNVLSMSPGDHYFYHISDYANEIWYEEDSAEVQQHNVFTRNTQTEDLINIRITPTWGGNPYDMYDRARVMAQADVDDFDMIETAHFRGFMSGMLGYYYNLYDVETLDMGAYWWNREYVDCYTHDFDDLTTITGDCLIFDDLAAKAIFYNKAMIENFNLEDPTLLVENGAWTVEKMMEMAAAVTHDSDGDGIMTDSDTWGVMDNYGVAVINFFDGFGIRLGEKDENDIPYLAAEDAEVINAVQFVYEKVTRSGYINNADEDVHTDMLKSDRGLFINESLGFLYELRDMESDFSLLPLPKYNEAQERYSSITSGAVTTVVAIPITVKDTDRVGNIMNVFGGFSTDTVDCSLNEVILGAKLIRDKRTVDMLGYVLDSKYYDWAKDLKWAFPIYQAMTDQGYAEQFFFVSRLKSVARESKAMLKMFLKGYSFY